MSPSNRSETKQAPPCGVTPIKHLNVFVCLYEENAFPCWAKSLKLSDHGLLRAETLGVNLKIRNRKPELGLYACYVYFI